MPFAPRMESAVVKKKGHPPPPSPCCLIARPSPPPPGEHPATAISVPSGENDGSLSPLLLLGMQVGRALLAVAATRAIGVVSGQWFKSTKATFVPSGDHDGCSSKPGSATRRLVRPPATGTVSRSRPWVQVLMKTTVLPSGLTSGSSTQPAGGPEIVVDAPPVAGTFARVEPPVR